MEYSGYQISVQDHLAIHRANQAYEAAYAISINPNSTSAQKKQAEADMKAATAKVDAILANYTKATNDVSGSKSTEVTSPDVVGKIAEDVISSNAPEVVKALAGTYVKDYTSAYKIYKDSVSSSSSKAQAKADMDAILAKLMVAHNNYVDISDQIVIDNYSVGEYISSFLLGLSYSINQNVTGGLIEWGMEFFAGRTVKIPNKFDPIEEQKPYLVGKLVGDVLIWEWQ